MERLRHSASVSCKISSGQWHVSGVTYGRLGGLCVCPSPLSFAAKSSLKFSGAKSQPAGHFLQTAFGCKGLSSTNFPSGRRRPQSGQNDQAPHAAHRLAGGSCWKMTLLAGRFLGGLGCCGCCGLLLHGHGSCCRGTRAARRCSERHKFSAALETSAERWAFVTKLRLQQRRCDFATGPSSALWLAWGAIAAACCGLRRRRKPRALRILANALCEMCKSRITLARLRPAKYISRNWWRSLGGAGILLLATQPPSRCGGLLLRQPLSGRACWAGFLWSSRRARGWLRQPRPGQLKMPGTVATPVYAQNVQHFKANRPAPVDDRARLRVCWSDQNAAPELFCVMLQLFVSRMPTAFKKNGLLLEALHPRALRNTAQQALRRSYCCSLLFSVLQKSERAPGLFSAKLPRPRPQGSSEPCKVHQGEP